jgi:hypothetical protein
MTTELQIIATTDRAVLGTLTMGSDGTVSTSDGLAADWWQAKKRLSGASDKDLFAWYVEHGWANMAAALVPAD